MRGICNKEAHDSKSQALQTRLFPGKAQESDVRKKARHVTAAGLI
jgi:hypothetical protein